MSNTTKIGICLCAILLTTSGAMAATYYVDAQNPVASDNSPGTEAVPWETITKACRAAQAGDTVLIKAGTYREALMPKNSGKPGAPITFQAYPGDFVMIKGSKKITGFTKEGDHLWVKRPWNQEKRQWDDSMKAISDAPYGRSARQEEIFVNERPLAWVPSRAELVPGSLVWDYEAKELVIYPYAPIVDLNAQLVELPVLPHILCLWQDDIRGWEALRRDPDLYDPARHPANHYIHIKDLHFRHAAHTLNRTGVRLDGDHWLLEDCTVEYMNCIGIATCGAYDVVRRCESSHNGQSGFSGSGEYALIEDCTTRFNNRKAFASHWGGGGSKWTVVENCTVRRLVSAFNRHGGLWFDIDCKNVTIEDCVAVGNWDERFNAPGYHYEISSDALIKNNIAFGCHGARHDMHPAAAGVYIADSSRVRVEGNIIINCDDGIHMAEGTRDTWRGYYNCFDNTVQGNTILNSRIFAAQLRQIPGSDPADPAGRNIFRNNTILHRAPSPPFEWSGQAYDSLAQFEADNLWVANNRWITDWKEFEIEHDRWGTIPSHKEILDNAFGRILKATAPEFSELDPDTVQLQDTWYLTPDNRGIGYWLDAAGQKILLVDLVNAAEFNFIRPDNASVPVRVWSGWTQQWTDISADKYEITIPFEHYVSVVTGLPANVQPPSGIITAYVNTNAHRAHSVLDGAMLELVTKITNPWEQQLSFDLQIPTTPTDTERLTVELPAGAHKIIRRKVIATPSLASAKLTVTSGPIEASIALPLRVYTALDIAQTTRQFELDGDAAKYGQPLITFGPGAPDLLTKTHIAWDAQALHALFDVADDRVRPREEGGAIWNADCIEVFVDCRRNNLGRYPYTRGSFQMFIVPPLASQIQPAQWHCAHPLPHPPTVVGQKTATGYRVELTMPWANFPDFTPQSGALFGFEVAMDEADEKPTRQAYIAWHGSGQNWRLPQLLGRLRLK